MTDIDNDCHFSKCRSTNRRRSPVHDGHDADLLHDLGAHQLALLEQQGEQVDPGKQRTLLRTFFWPATPCASSPPWPFIMIILFLSATLLNT
jgi:hypothetical protein